MNKILSTVIDITQLIHSKNCTYKETDEIIKILSDEIKQQREDYEYETVENYLRNCKKRNADNIVIESLHHVDKYL